MINEAFYQVYFLITEAQPFQNAGSYSGSLFWVSQEARPAGVVNGLGPGLGDIMEYPA
jgi:hypothetical protein